MDECRLTPVELFFLGVLMDAEYIDYDYITSIPEITDNYRVIEQQTLDRLEDKQLIEQEFDGSVTVDEQLEFWRVKELCQSKHQRREYQALEM